MSELLSHLVTTRTSMTSSELANVSADAGSGALHCSYRMLA
jgi:hypothetical protein